MAATAPARIAPREREIMPVVGSPCIGRDHVPQLRLMSSEDASAVATALPMPGSRGRRAIRFATAAPSHRHARHIFLDGVGAVVKLISDCKRRCRILWLWCV